MPHRIPTKSCRSAGERRHLRVGAALATLAAALAVQPVGAQTRAPGASYRIAAPILDKMDLRKQGAAQPLDLTISSTAASGQGGEIDAGTVVTTGYGEHGVAISQGGSTIIRVERAETYGDRADGVHAVLDGEGSVTVEAGAIATHGYRANGIDIAQVPVNYADAGQIRVTAGSVATEGAASTGIRVNANFGLIDVTAQEVTTTGEGSDAIDLYAAHGDVVLDVTTVATSGTAGRGIVAYSGGTTTIDAGSVTTTGAGSSRDADAGAIMAVGTAVKVTAGEVSTSGDFSAGIYASSNFTSALEQDDHDISVTAGSVATQGYFASGIVASGIVAVNLSGNTAIDAGTVSTLGDRSAGIYTYSLLGDTAIRAGDVSTSGSGSVAIGARGLYGGSIAIEAGNVSTSGDSARAIEALSGPGADPEAQGDVDILVHGDVRTTGAFSDGILGYSATGDVSITSTGSVRTLGYGSYGVIGVALSSDVRIDAAKIETGGVYGVGVLGFAGGDLDIKVGEVQTEGPLAPAIVGSASGDVTVIADKVGTKGPGSEGVLADAGGHADITVGDLRTLGDFSTGIEVRGASTAVTILNSLTTSGDYSRGVRSLAYGGTATIRNDGDVATLGVASTALYALGRDGVTIEGDGNVTTYGYLASGVVGASFAGGEITITQGGKVETRGDKSTGIYAGIRDFYDTGAAGDIMIHADTVATHGAQSRGIMAINQGGGGIDIRVDGNISTRKQDSHAIYAIAPYATVKVDVGGDIATRGPDSFGVIAVGNDTNVTVGGTITTFGDDSAAIYSYAIDGVATVKVADIVTEGDVSQGIIAIGERGVSIDAGTIVAKGAESTGIFAGSGNFGAIGDIRIKADSVTVEGIGAVAINAQTPSSGNIDIDVGSVVTRNDFSIGVAMGTKGGDIKLRADTIRTEGEQSWGLYAANANGGGITVSTGTVETFGVNATAVRTFSEGGHVAVDADKIATHGYHSQGMLIQAIRGPATIRSTGSITTTGGYSEGVRVNTLNTYSVVDVASVTTTGDRSVGIHVFAVGDIDKSATVKAGSIATSGAGAHGIWLENPNDGVIIQNDEEGGIDVPEPPVQGSRDLRVTAGTIKVSGEGANGVYGISTGAFLLDLGSVSSAKAEAIKVIARDAATLSVHGAITSGTTSAVDIAGSDITVQIDKGAKIEGRNGLVLLANGPPQESGPGFPGLPGIPGDGGPIFFGAMDEIPEDVHGYVRLTNAGTIIGTEFAILADAGQTSIVNSGTIQGAIRTQFYDDSFENSGTWSFSADSDFGDGVDTLTNNGLVQLTGAGGGRGATNVSLIGLDRFINNGTISLKNGTAGDTLTLPGDYVAGTGATLALDVGGPNGAADKLTIGGSVSGTTALMLASADPRSAALLATPVTLVEASGAMKADAFTLANGDAGFVQYGLTYDAANHRFGLTSQAGAAVYRFARMTEAAQSLWLKSADGWSSHMASLRDAPDGQKRLWGQMFGGSDKRDERLAIAVPGTPDAAYNLGYRQDYYGAQLGYDLLRGEDFVAGGTASYLNSKQNFRASADKASFDAIDLGIYAGYRSGPLFANLLVKYDRYWIDATSADLGTTGSLDGNSFGATLTAGARFGGDSWFFEPAATLAWQSTGLDDLAASGQSIDFDRTTGLRGKIGGRLGGTASIGGTQVVYYAGGNFVHDFKGGTAATLSSGGTSASIDGERIADHGQAMLGLTIGSPTGPVAVTLEGTANFGGSYSGGGGRVGFRWKF